VIEYNLERSTGHLTHVMEKEMHTGLHFKNLKEKEQRNLAHIYETMTLKWILK
jgi:hypothetical protein